MSTTTDSAAAIAERLQNDADQVLRAAEEILFNADGPGSFTPSQITVLRTAGQADRDIIEKELGRVRSVREHMASAGTNSQFAAAQERLSAAAEQERLLRPELQETIRAAEKKLNTLTAELRSAQNAADQMRHARENLRSERLLPRFAREEIALFERSNCTQLHQEIAQLDDRLAVIRGAVELDPSTDGALFYSRAVDGQHKNDASYHPMVVTQDIVNPDGTGSVTHKVIASNLRSHQEELRAEEPAVLAQREAAIAELVRLRSTLQGVREWYVSQLAD